MCAIISILCVAMTGCIGSEGRAVLDKAFGAREAVWSGILEIERTVRVRDGSTETRRETAYFDGEHYRLDVHAMSDFTPWSDAPPGPLFIMAWNGRHVIQQRVNVQHYSWSIHAEDRASAPMYNARTLGLPARPGPNSDVRRLFRPDGNVVSMSECGDLITVRLNTTRSTGDDERLTLTLDRSRGWSVVAYVLESRQFGIDFTIKGTAELAQFGDVWFPRRFKREQYRNGVLDWVQEYRIVRAEFNAPLDENKFTWKATKIYKNAHIVSYVPGEGHLMWDGNAAVPQAEVLHRRPPSQTSGKDGAVLRNLGPGSVVVASLIALAVFVVRNRRA